jgi:hypothetical protein
MIAAIKTKNLFACEMTLKRTSAPVEPSGMFTSKFEPNRGTVPVGRHQQAGGHAGVAKMAARRFADPQNQHSARSALP